jgi:hypothetical protein
MERVEKAYLQNWDTLYFQKRVETPEPEVSWGKTRKLLKTLFVRHKPEQIIQAINNGLKDDWFINTCGYTLSAMLSADMFNRLINAKPEARARAGPPAHRIAADNIPPEDIEKYFT